MRVCVCVLCVLRLISFTNTFLKTETKTLTQILNIKYRLKGKCLTVNRKKSPAKEIKVTHPYVHIHTYVLKNKTNVLLSSMSFEKVNIGFGLKFFSISDIWIHLLLKRPYPSLISSSLYTQSCKSPFPGLFSPFHCDIGCQIISGGKQSRRVKQWEMYYCPISVRFKGHILYPLSDLSFPQLIIKKYL